MKEKYLEQIQQGIKCTNSYRSSEDTLSILEESNTLIDKQSHALLFVEKSQYDFWRLYFYIQDISKITWGFFQGKKLVAEIIVRESQNEKWEPIVQTFQEKGGFKLYDTFIRLYKDKIDIDVQDVDFSMVETPCAGDFLKIKELLEANFDVYCDRIPSVEELESLAKTTFVIKDNGQIVAFFIAEKKGVTLVYRYWLVLQNYRGRKYGDILMKRILTSDQEIERITSWISQKLDYSILAHKRLGFKEDGLKNYILYKES
ncbi:GNAT family N-acetyltransferase [Flavobacterium paronense]|uniref:GNAT family N-acetyltransferase n=1 Tax=Flavobacterium paronense TaxID=1392775 RepID=A0ABV5GFL3_9FLAO|nr:GNAT family N-acetyltransferase [Flavobacterium paronense]MDN3676042.1 GNAT family N-acetyltransferase [Flavobacterium paronense]